jgi:hypothetical protein
MHLYCALVITSMNAMPSYDATQDCSESQADVLSSAHKAARECKPAAGRHCFQVPVQEPGSRAASAVTSLAPSPDPSRHTSLQVNLSYHLQGAPDAWTASHACAGACHTKAGSPGPHASLSTHDATFKRAPAHLSHVPGLQDDTTCSSMTCTQGAHQLLACTLPSQHQMHSTNDDAASCCRGQPYCHAT